MLYRLFSSCGEWGLLFVAFHGLLIAVAPLVGEHGLWGARSTGSVVVAYRLSCSLACGNLPGSEELVSLALAGKFFTTEPPGKP